MAISGIIKPQTHFSNGKKIVFNKNGGFLDIDKKDYYDSQIREAIECCISFYQCYLYWIGTFPERFEKTPEYFHQEINAIMLCVKQGWKMKNLTTVDDIIFRLKHTFGIGLIVSGFVFSLKQD